MTELFADLPSYLSHHLELTVIALACGIAISLPTALALVRRPRLRYPVLTVVGIIQTVPSLALLALMVPLLAKTNGLGLSLPAFGFYPAVFALTLYSLLPIVRNTVTGILDIDAEVIEAARGVGMTWRQTLLQVELPLAAPVIIAGIRTATVWIVGIATLATPVGQPSLGNYIFAGLQTKNWPMVMFGVACAAALAIVLDLLIGGLQKAADSRNRVLSWVTGGSLLALFLVGLMSPTLVEWTRADRTRSARMSQGTPGSGSESSRESGPENPVDHRLNRPIRIGAKTFTEQYILAEVVSDSLERAGFAVTRVESLGSTIVFDALKNQDIDVYIDYSGTIWANYMKRTDVPSPWRVLAEMDGWLAREHGIRDLGSLGFENAYALAMRKNQARALGIRSIADLAAHAPDLSIGGDYEFFSRPEWQQIRDQYGLHFKHKSSFDSTLMYDAVATGQVDVISAFSSDGRIAAFDLVVLEDPRHVIPPYDAILLLGPSVAERGDVAQALQGLVGAIPLETMQRANLMVDRDTDKKTPRQAAQWLVGTMVR